MRFKNATARRPFVRLGAILACVAVVLVSGVYIFRLKDTVADPLTFPQTSLTSPQPAIGTTTSTVPEQQPWDPKLRPDDIPVTNQVFYEGEPVLKCDASLNASPNNRMRNMLLEQFYDNVDPFCKFDNPYKFKLDWTYPFTHASIDLIEWVIKRAAANPGFQGFFLEAGTMTGGSADRFVEAATKLGLQDQITLICIDPFSGDRVNWVKEYGHRIFLRLRGGAARIYDQFMMNMIERKRYKTIVPMAATSMAGMRSIERLIATGKLPQVDTIYLDSAHEAGETILELKAAWLILRPGGFIFGDDWSWQAVRRDVESFAADVSKNQQFNEADWSPELIAGSNPSRMPFLRLSRKGGQWILKKPLPT
jgi:hypothetical protein